LSVTATGTAPFTYQWYLGASGDASQPVAGATSATFTTPALTITTSYWVKVTNVVTSTNSNTATVTVVSFDSYTQWKNARFSAADAANASISGPAADPDHDGFSNQEEFVLGSMPTDSVAPDTTTIHKAGGQMTLSFMAQMASGPGYSGLTRLYTVESTDNLNGGPWTSLPGFIDIAGNDQLLDVPLSTTGPRKFFRLNVRLTP
jgi:hypothetical protein